MMRQVVAGVALFASTWLAPGAGAVPDAKVDMTVRELRELLWLPPGVKPGDLPNDWAEVDQLEAMIARMERDPEPWPAWAREWAGHYSGSQNMLMSNVWISPDGRVLTQFGGGCVQVCPGHYLVREAMADRLLVDEIPFGGCTWSDSCRPTEIALIRWGARRYAIPERDLQSFCYAVNEGTVAVRPGDYPLKVNGGTSVAGLPEVPGAARQWLLAAPVRAEVVRVDDVCTPDERFNELQASIVLNVGAEQGIAKAMRFWPVGADAEDFAYASVQDVRAGECTLLYYSSGFLTSEPFRPTPGMVFSTLRRARPER